jgi:hypothetical protein
VAADADPTRAAKTLFNPFRIDIGCDSAFAGFAPRAELFHPYGLASHGLLLCIEHNHIALGSPGPALTTLKGQKMSARVLRVKLGV